MADTIWVFTVNQPVHDGQDGDAKGDGPCYAVLGGTTAVVALFCLNYCSRGTTQSLHPWNDILIRGVPTFLVGHIVGVVHLDFVFSLVFRVR